MTNSMAYMEGGPYQERAVEEKEPESNGNNTHMQRGIQERKERQGQETKNQNKNHLKHKLTF